MLIQRFVVNSTNTDITYAFFMPIVCRMWRHIGYEPVAILLGNQEEWNTNPHSRYILEHIKLNSDKILFLERINAFKDSTLVQLSRLFAAATDIFSDDHYILTSDVDMLPLNKDFYYQQDLNIKIHLFGPDAYASPRFPICYLGARRSIWLEVMDITVSNLQNAMESTLDTNLDNWNYDEFLFYKKITTSAFWPEQCQFINRGWPHGLASKRLDRACWNFNHETDLIDCHSLRPGHLHWNLLADVLKTYSVSDDFLYLQEYKSWFDNNLE